MIGSRKDVWRKEKEGEREEELLEGEVMHRERERGNARTYALTHSRTHARTTAFAVKGLLAQVVIKEIADSAEVVAKNVATRVAGPCNRLPLAASAGFDPHVSQGIAGRMGCRGL